MPSLARADSVGLLDAQAELKELVSPTHQLPPITMPTYTPLFLNAE